MWDDPRLLNRISAAVLLAAGLAAGVVATRALTEAIFPFRQVTVLGARQAETQRGVAQVVRGLKGGFFTLDLEAARAGFEAIPWVRQATVRRLWPNRLLVQVSEHVPAAAWNGQQVLDIHGEIFAVRPWAGLPRLHAPEGSEREVSRRLAEFHAILAPAGWRIEALQVSPRRAWRLALESGGVPPARAQVSLELGREKLAERVRRFVTFYASAVEDVGQISKIDLRYPNGFAAQRPNGFAAQRPDGFAAQRPADPAARKPKDRQEA